MKKIILLFIITLTHSSLFAQNLSLSQLIELTEKDMGEAEEYLTTKGWEFSDAGKESDSRKYMTFAYNKSSYSSGAESFLSILYDDILNKGVVSIQVHTQEKYNEYLNYLKKYNYKLIDSIITEGSLLKMYQGETMTFGISSTTSKNYFNEETAIWSLLIISNDDFESYRNLHTSTFE